METTIKDQVKNIFKTNSYETAMELTKGMYLDYLREYGLKSWNALASYYKKVNIQPEVSHVAEPKKGYSNTPLMTQYTEMKKKHPDAILLFRIGDFYETFNEDAVCTSEILGITLTRRANGKAANIELAGFPHHALDSYLPKLVRAGKRVAICEQLDDPQKMEVREIVTPDGETKEPSTENHIAPDTVSKNKTQSEADDHLEYMVYRNTGDKIEWFGHRENFYGLKVGATAKMIRMNNRGVSEGVVVASKLLTLDQVSLFHRCYGVIIRMKRSYKEQLDMVTICLNNLPEAISGADKLPSDDVKLTDLVLNSAK